MPVFLQKFYTAVLLTVFLNPSINAQQNSDRGSLSGLVYSDFYWIINNHNEDLEGENGFWARRVYFTYDNNISRSVTARIRLEMNSPGDYSSQDKLEPFIKDIYAKWAINDNHSLIAGISPTPTWGLVERVWGYRSVEKSPVDLYKLGSSRDFGVALQGRLSNAGNLRYHAMFGNGSGTRAETNKWKKYMLSLAWWFSDSLVIEAYGDYNRLDEINSRTTGHVMAGYLSEKINLGAIYAVQSRNQKVASFENTTDILDVASLFSNFKINNKWTAILRADHMFEPNPQGSTIDYIPFSEQASSTLMLFGIDYQPIPKLHLIPNIGTVFYGKAADESTPNNDLIFRTTLYYTF